MTKFSFVTLTLLVGVGGAIAACSSSGDDTAATGGAGGTGGKSSSAGSAGKSSTAGTGTGTVAEGGAAGAASTSIYEDLGENAGIAAAVDAIVAAEVADPDIASYFSQSANPAYSPQVADIEACLVIQLDAISGGPYTYPAKTAAGYQCRDMVTTHADLGINGATFDKFVTIAAGVLTAAKVPEADLASLAGVLVGTKPAIVTDTTTTVEKPCTAPAACAPGAAGAGGAG